MNCKLCAHDKINLLFRSHNVHGRHILSHETFEVYACPRCGVVFTDVEPDESYYSKYYPKDYYYESNNCVVRFVSYFLKFIGFRRRFCLIKPYFNKGRFKNILEIGCGRADFLVFLPGFFRKVGVDIDQKCCEHIRAHHAEIAVFNKKVDKDWGFIGEEKFDVIGMWHVLEHMDDPHVFLEGIKKNLSREGIFIFDIPNAGSLGFKWAGDSWFHLDTPRHLFLYNRQSIEGLMRKHGFRIVHYSANPTDYFQDLAFSLYNRFKKNGILGIFLALILLPGAIVARLFISIFFPDFAEINTYILKHASSYDEMVQLT